MFLLTLKNKTIFYQILVVLLQSPVLFLYAPTHLLGMVVGALLMGVNFWVFTYLAEKLLHTGTFKLLYAVAILAKFVLMMAVVFVLMYFVRVTAVALGLGIGTWLVALFAASLHAASTLPNTQEN